VVVSLAVKSPAPFTLPTALILHTFHTLHSLVHLPRLRVLHLYGTFVCIIVGMAAYCQCSVSPRPLYRLFGASYRWSDRVEGDSRDFARRRIGKRNGILDRRLLLFLRLFQISHLRLFVLGPLSLWRWPSTGRWQVTPGIPTQSTTENLSSSSVLCSVPRVSRNVVIRLKHPVVKKFFTDFVG
jgi:hypothetical protein